MLKRIEWILRMRPLQGKNLFYSPIFQYLNLFGRRITCLKLLFMLVIASNHAHAADVTLTGTQICPIRISGIIEIGDLQKVIAATDRVGWTTQGRLVPPISTEGDPSRVICLSGNGGSYLEGRSISNFLFENGFGTRISASDSCYSACAFIFLAGRNKGDEVDGVNRSMHVTSIVGFHAPYFTPPENRSFSAADVQGINNLFRLIFSDMLKFFSWRSHTSHQPSISMSTLGRIMSSGPTEFVFISTIEDAMRFNVRVEGHRVRAQSAPQALTQLCRNILDWMADKESKQINSSDAQITRIPNRSGTNTLFQVVFSGYADQKCVISPADSGYTVCVENEYNGQGLGRCPGWGLFFPAISALPPKTSLRSLASR